MARQFGHVPLVDALALVLLHCDSVEVAATRHLPELETSKRKKSLSLDWLKGKSAGNYGFYLSYHQT